MKTWQIPSFDINSVAPEELYEKIVSITATHSGVRYNAQEDAAVCKSERSTTREVLIPTCDGLSMRNRPSKIATASPERTPNGIAAPGVQKRPSGCLLQKQLRLARLDVEFRPPIFSTLPAQRIQHSRIERAIETKRVSALAKYIASVVPGTECRSRGFRGKVLSMTDYLLQPNDEASQSLITSCDTRAKPDAGAVQN